MTNARTALLANIFQRPPHIESHDAQSAPTMIVFPWRDPVVERVGHDAGSDYVELFWLNSLGPTATWLLRRLAVITVTHPDGFVVDLTALNSALGLGSDTGSTSVLARSLGRLMMFGLGRVEGRHLEVRAIIPPLPLKQVARLPQHLQQAHEQWSDVDPTRALERGFTCGHAHTGYVPAALALRLGEVQRQIDQQTSTESGCAASQPGVIGIGVHGTSDIQMSPGHIASELGQK
jgi:hypothetical protein